MSLLIIKGGRLIDPKRGIDRVGSLIISGDKISNLIFDAPLSPEPDARVLDARGLVVAPGFIDLHCHLRDPGFTSKETIATGSRAAARGGFTTICCMPNTNPPLDNQAAINYVRETAAREATVRVLPIGCITEGREGKKLADLNELTRAGVVGFSDDGSPVMDSGLIRQALTFSRMARLPIMDHCEDINLSRGGHMNEGMMSDRLGTPGIPAAAEDIMVYRDLTVAELTGGWLHICHVSTATSVSLIKRAKEKGIRVTAEATPHHLTLNEAVLVNYDPNAKVNPPLRTEGDVRALVKGLKEGVIDIIATDHAPHTEAEKAQGIALAPPGISIFETALGMLMWLVGSGELTLNEIIARLTAEPAKLLGDRYSRLGTLAPGGEADVTVFDPDKEWVIDVSEFVSKGRNTPLKGATLRGKVMSTVCGGEIVYRDSAVKLSEKGYS